MRHAATVLSLCIALVSGVVLALCWEQPPLSSLSIQAVPSADVEETAATFYQAVNTYLDSGDDLPLRRILHPAFTNHDPGSPANGNAATFLQQLDSIRTLYPGMRLTPEVEYLGNNTASVSLTVSDRQRREFAGIGIDPAEMIGRLDLLRIERRLIVERWSYASLSGELDTFPAVSLELPVALDTLIARVQQISLDEVPESIVDPFWHLLLIVQSGEARLDVVEAATVPVMQWRVDQRHVAEPKPIQPGTFGTLDSMEAVFLPAGTRFRLWDAGARNTTLLALEFGPPVSVQTSTSSPHIVDELEETLWSGISLSGVGKRLALAFGRATLLPQATLWSRDVNGMELSWVGSGAIEMSVASGTACVRDASGVRSQLQDGHALLQPDDAGAAGPGANIAYRATGNGSATVWFFSIVPIDVDANAHDTGAPNAIPTAPPPRTAS